MYHWLTVAQALNSWQMLCLFLIHNFVNSLNTKMHMQRHQLKALTIF